MRALIVDSDQASAWSLADRLTEAGFTVIGPARSSGEALLLAACEQPEIAVLNVNLESLGAGERLADKLTSRHSTHCILTATKASENTTRRDSIDKADYGKIADAVVNHRKQRKWIDQIPGKSAS